MTPAGLTLAGLSALGVLAVVIILLLYRLRDYRRKLVVPSLELYSEALRRLGRTQRSLKQQLSIALQVLLVALLLFALGGPSLESKPRSPRHLLLLVDTSASMLAREGGATRLDSAKVQLLRLLESLEPESQVLLATADVALAVELSFTSDHAAVARAVSRLTARPLPSRWQACLDSAQGYLVEKSRPELVIVTDGAASAFDGVVLPKGLSTAKPYAVLVGKRRDNVAILGFSPRRRPTAPMETETLLRLGNFGESTERFSVDLYAEDRLVGTTSYTLAANETKSVFGTVSLAQERRLRAKVRLEGRKEDALRVDDEAYAILGSPRRSKLLVRTNGDLYLEAAVLSNPWLSPVFQRLDEALSQSRYDAAIVEGGPLPDPLESPTLWLNPPANSPYVVGRQSLSDFGFDQWDLQQPILAGLELFDVQIKDAHPLAPDRNSRVLARSGNSPIVLETTRNGFPLLIVGFDPKRSDFVLRPAFPLFIEQATSYLLTTAIAPTVAARTGAATVFNRASIGPVDALPLQMRSATGDVRELPESQGHVTWEPDELGFFEVLSTKDSSLRTWAAANLFDEQESRLVPVTTLTLGALELHAPSISPPRKFASPSTWLLLGTALLLVIEWFTFHRRITV